MSVHSAVGLATAGGLTTYDVRSCTRGQAADNKAQAGRTPRQK